MCTWGYVGKVGRAEVQKTRRNFWGDGYVYYLDCSEQLPNSTHVSRSIKLYTLNIHSLLYTNYTSVKVIKSQKAKWSNEPKLLANIMSYLIKYLLNERC